jgi:bis(5'-nucleosyl)-tetraphosphatase (symmetrical)
MTTYAIGDVQGCLEPLLRLLEALRFDRDGDRLVFVGDLVNRGPASAEVLRFVRGLGACASTVLGNHDLHLLAVACRQDRVGRRDSFEDVLSAPDRDELLAWLAQQPLVWEDPDSGALVLHAGVAPQWDRAQVLALAREAEAVIGGPQAAAFYAQMYGDQPDRWDEALQGWERLRFIVNCLTRLRYCRRDGGIDLEHKERPGTQPAELLPWFEIEGRRSAAETFVFGHWSTLGRVSWNGGRICGLDTGCVWGGSLTAMNLANGELVSTGCGQFRKPGGHQD